MPTADADRDGLPMSDPSGLIALSVLSLDHPAPTTGWASFLADRGISRSAGRPGPVVGCVSDARQLLTEQRENEARRARLWARPSAGRSKMTSASGR